MELEFDCVGLVFEFIQVVIDLSPEVGKLVQGLLSFILELLGQRRVHFGNCKNCFLLLAHHLVIS